MLTSFKRESLALHEHNQFAESALASEDGVKNLLAERMQKELEMKRKCSVVRLRWINAINRVLIQNYIDKVKIRLAKYEADHGPLFTPKAVGRAKLVRRTLDNSKLPSLSVNTHLANSTSHSPSGNNTPTLPSISPSNMGSNRERRRSMAKSTDHNQFSRRSFDPSAGGSHLKSISERKIPTIEELTEKAERGVPTLRKSYTDVSASASTTKLSIKALDPERRGGVMKAIK